MELNEWKQACNLGRSLLRLYVVFGLRDAVPAALPRYRTRSGTCSRPSTPPNDIHDYGPGTS